MRPSWNSSSRARPHSLRSFSVRYTVVNPTDGSFALMIEYKSSLETCPSVSKNTSRIKSRWVVRFSPARLRCSWKIFFSSRSITIRLESPRLYTRGSNWPNERSLARFAEEQIRKLRSQFWRDTVADVLKGLPELVPFAASLADMTNGTFAVQISLRIWIVVVSIHERGFCKSDDCRGGNVTEC